MRHGRYEDATGIARKKPLAIASLLFGIEDSNIAISADIPHALLVFTKWLVGARSERCFRCDP